jgi:hypothetical protein
MVDHELRITLVPTNLFNSACGKPHFANRAASEAWEPGGF